MTNDPNQGVTIVYVPTCPSYSTTNKLHRLESSWPGLPISVTRFSYVLSMLEATQKAKGI